MKKIFTLVLFLIPYIATGQFSVVSTEPANNTKNVPLTATISITFSEALDTNAMNSEDIWFSNIDNDSMISYGYSGDLKTTWGIYKLQSNTAYFVSFNYAKAKSGAVMTTPYVYYFTTGSDFPPLIVSGTVSSGTTGITTENALIALATVNILKDEGKEGPPPFYMGALVQGNGSFTVPNIVNGTYWPIAVKDVDHDGKINPDNGIDVIAFGDSIVVNGANITGLNLEFITFGPLAFADALEKADSMKKDISNDYTLKQISSWNTDTLGQTRDWNFIYTRSETEGYEIRVSSFDNRIQQITDMSWLQWLNGMRPLINQSLAAPLTVVIPNVENQGGKEFRNSPPQQDMQFNIECRLSDHNNDDFSNLVPDQNKFYWGVIYRYGYENDSGWSNTTEMRFLCDFTTGAVLPKPNAVKEIHVEVPEKFVLNQNYPNPFNPVTTIRYAVPHSGFVSIKIYDMLGKEISCLVNETQSAGWKEVQWSGSEYPSGVYLYRMVTNGFTQTKKLLLLK